MRLVMMGTGPFALPTFNALIDSRHEVVGLVTQPDRTGRGHHRHPHPMKERAVAAGIPLLQPQNVNASESIDQLNAWDADLNVVAAYGQILKPAVIESARYGSINLHGSLLPRHRGAAPVQYTIWEGDSETGVTIFQIEPKLDAGRILGVVKTPVSKDETSGELMQRLSELAPQVTLEVLEQIESGTAAALPQDSSLVTRAPRLTKQDGRIDWTEPAERIQQQVRAMQPWPKAYTYWLRPDAPPLRLLVLKSAVVEDGTDDNRTPVSPGTILTADHHDCLVQTGTRPLKLQCVQVEGKRATEIGQFLNGHPIASGQRLGEA